MKFAWDITEDAALDLDQIEDYIVSYSADIDYAASVVDAIVAEFDAICAHPLLHAVYVFPEGFAPLRDYRSVNVQRYKIFYHVDEAQKLVHIYRICHLVSDFTRVGF